MARHKCVGATNRMEYLCFVDENRYVCIYLFGGYCSYLQVRIVLHDKNETLVSDLLKNDSTKKMDGIDLVTLLLSSATELDEVIRTIVKKTEQVENNTGK